ncbi:hypothetical protein AAEU29_10990 [Pseudoalteromonas sp. SSM20]|uniref:hypothetical protein n=1 Tax=Pseudoalteromonas TaxID=53246 RepID=UPI00110A921D|nr:hypothetical protein [Pseudoalteromonas spongiae]TMO84206.1 hypothetical protein CWC15_11405 [Pseudoalteromonas spongiae]
MEVKYLGFKISSTEQRDISIRDLFEFLSTPEGVVDESKSNVRHLYANESTCKKYYVGLVVTVKNQKKFCKAAPNSEGFTIQVDNLTGKDKFLDFNFFIINKSNGLGLYQHYHNSCSMNVFGSYLKSYFNRLRRVKIESEIDTLELAKSRELKKSEKKNINLRYKATLSFTPLVRKEKLEEILKEYAEIKSFEFEYSYLEDDVKRATPLSKYVKHKREKITFVKSNPLKEVAKGIKNFVLDKSINKGRVVALTYEGETEAIRLFDIPDCFHLEEYDEVASKLDGLKVSSFETHSFIQEMINTYESDEYAHIFRTCVEQ